MWVPEGCVLLLFYVNLPKQIPINYDKMEPLIVILPY